MGRLLRLVEEALKKEIPGTERVGSIVHFLFQPSRFSQRLYSFAIRGNKARVEYVEGTSLADIVNEGNKIDWTWLYNNREEVIKQMAQIYVDLIRLGALFEDPNWANFILRKTEDGGVRVFLIDYENEKLKDLARNTGKKVVDLNSLVSFLPTETPDIDIPERLKEEYKIFSKTLVRFADFAGEYENSYMPDFYKRRLEQHIRYRELFVEMFKNYVEGELERI